ncbi:MAG: hypothetical protein A4E72_01788 [Syntrophus sp. PtaU1.Bin208]|nr:MAG: hypothetical protein A4E72_01788 [Syntrophus sp. PtaU1.Bin208]
MGDPSGQHAQTLEFLNFAHLDIELAAFLLHLPAFRQIVEKGKRLVSHSRSKKLDIFDGSILAGQLHFYAGNAADLIGGPIQYLVQALDGVLPVFRIGEGALIPIRQSGDVLHRITELFGELWIDVFDPAFLVGKADGQRRGLHHEPEPLLAFAEGLLRLLPFGDEPRLLDVLIRRGGKLIGQGEKGLGDLFELFLRHERHFVISFTERGLVEAQLMAVLHDLLFALLFIPDLADQPVGDVTPADGDAGAGAA